MGGFAMRLLGCGSRLVGDVGGTFLTQEVDVDAPDTSILKHTCASGSSYSTCTYLLRFERKLSSSLHRASGCEVLMRCSTMNVLSNAGLSLRVLYHIWCEKRQL